MHYPAHYSVAQCFLFAVGRLVYSVFSLVFNKEDNGDNNILFIKKNIYIKKVVRSEKLPKLI